MRHLEDVVAKTLKTLAMDAVERAVSGHPGMPMGMADAATVLWARYLVVDPLDPGFFGRDRFVLSAGHGSMLLYGLLHLAGFDLPLSELQRFRQLGSRTPGHPEVGLTPGVETTTGPLGQGFANGVGMAMAAAHLAARFNRPGFPVVDHWVYAICSDGDLHEGVSHEAACIAGHLGLGRLVYLHDDNQITIDGKTSLHTSEDTAARFRAYGWHVQEVDGHDREAVARAIEAARADLTRPSLIACRTHIGHGSPHKQDSEEAHGAPLGAEEVRLTKRALGWPEDAQFLVPDGAREAFAALRARGAARREAWLATMTAYRAAHPELARDLESALAGDGLPAGWEAHFPSFDNVPKEATRASSGKVLNALSPHLPALWGGSADLAGSNQTLIKGVAAISRERPEGRNIHFGIREHAMGSLMNGMALHGGIIPYGGTFLTFTDYMRPAMRLAALMQRRVIYVLTHDSLFLGEDGPTHQAVEHAMALRLIPNLHVLRPGDGRETAAAWLHALRRTTGPSALLLSRQALPQLPGSVHAREAVDRGAYVVHGGETRPDLLLLGTGSELHLCTGAAQVLEAEGFSVRVVSMLCAEAFLGASAEYQESVLPRACRARVSVEAGRTFGWERFVGPEGACVGIDRFGESAPANALAEHFGFTLDHVLQVARQALAKRDVA